MTRARTLTIACLIGVLLPAGCGGADPGQEEATTSVAAAVAAVEETAKPTPTPTPEPITREQAGENYLALAEAANAAAGVVNAPLEAGDVLAAREASTGTADALRAFADGLLAAEWPPEVQPAIDKLVAETAAEIPIWLQAAATTTDADFWNEISKLAPTGSAQEVRILLGLENVPVG